MDFNVLQEGGFDLLVSFLMSHSNLSHLLRRSPLLWNPTSWCRRPRCSGPTWLFWCPDQSVMQAQSCFIWYKFTTHLHKFLSFFPKRFLIASAYLFPRLVSRPFYEREKSRLGSELIWEDRTYCHTYIINVSTNEHDRTPQLGLLCDPPLNLQMTLSSFVKMTLWYSVSYAPLVNALLVMIFSIFLLLQYRKRSKCSTFISISLFLAYLICCNTYCAAHYFFS